jgi:carbonic anhydrase
MSSCGLFLLGGNQIMEKLVRGIHHFQSTTFEANRELFESLSHGQQPETLLITCSDSRIAPNMVMQTQPGDLFVLRNAGNLIPPYGAANGGEGATIEYAVAALGVSHAIVMGHSNCGAMKGLLDPEALAEMPLVSEWLKHAGATRQVVDECYPDLEGIDLLNAAIKENVLVQLDNLRTYPKVAALMAKGALTLHGWIYEIESGQILAYDQHVSHFVPITSGSVLPTLSSRLMATARLAKPTLNGHTSFGE